MKKTRIALVGGGSGGHFYPLMAIAEALRAEAGDEIDLYYFGPNPYKKEALEELNIAFKRCPAGKQRRYASILNFFDKFVIIWGIVVAFFKLLLLYPDVLMSKGGYTSVPMTIAARLLRIPVVIHESDSVPGRANKMAAKWARYIAVAYPEAARFFPQEKTALTGIPIRQSFFRTFENPHQALSILSDRPVVFITGGSSGAERINTLVLDSLDELLPHYTLLHQVGDANIENVRETAFARQLPKEQLDRYFILGHLDGEAMPAALQAANIVVARAGSTTLFEIALKGKPSIVIPIPETISHDQTTNAYTYARSGAAVVIEESNISDGLLTHEIHRILSDTALQQQMFTAAKNFTNNTAAATLASTLLGIAAEH